MPTINRKITESEVSQTINLSDYIGGAASTPEIKEAFTQAIIDRMLERTTEEHRDVNGAVFAPYSKAYKESLAFEVFGKNKDVNMTLTGDMLGSVDKISSSGTSIKFGVTGDEQIAKAFGNITGQRGKNKSVKRDFFGVSDKEIKEIAKNYKPKLGDDLLELATASFTKKILKALGVTDE